MDFVYLSEKRNRGWPWPEDSWGLDSIYGPNGWCHSCGIPLREQTGPLTLQARGLSPVKGVWIPNWQFDMICSEATLAASLGESFRLQVRPVAWHGTVQGAAVQFIAPKVGPEWFDPEELREAAVARNGDAGATCPECGIWRWMPVPYEQLPPVRPSSNWERFDLLASPEWFGAGAQSFPLILLRRALAQAIVEASPRDFKVQEIS
jgi:hypothetical protein